MPRRPTPAALLLAPAAAGLMLCSVLLAITPEPARAPSPAAPRVAPETVYRVRAVERVRWRWRAVRSHKRAAVGQQRLPRGKPAAGLPHMGRLARSTGRLATGALDTEVLTLNGTTEVVGAKTWERILSAVLSASSGTRTVTLKQGSGGTTRHTFAPNQTAAYIFFQNSASESGSTTRDEKFFWKNTNGTLTLNSATVTLTADPASKITIALAATKNDSGSIANRKAGTGLTYSDDNVALSVPGGVLAAGDAIGVWPRLSLGAGDAAQKTSFTTQLAGTTV